MSSKKSPRTVCNELPPANAHSWRPPPGSPSDPDIILAALPIGTPDYLRATGADLAKYNSPHSKNNKGVSFKTMHDRQRMVAGFFYELRHETRYRNLDPRQLANRHIQAMVARWLQRGLSTATIHNYLSFLRTFAGWIGKAGMVREPEFYLGADSPHAHRSEVATEDRSGSAMNGAITTRDAAHPRDTAAFAECRTFLHISAGSKGGRPRDIPIQTQAQQDLLDRVMKLVPPGSFVGRPGYTSLQNEARFFNVIRKFGICKAELGVVSHGLRHQYANVSAPGIWVPMPACQRLPTTPLFDQSRRIGQMATVQPVATPIGGRTRTDRVPSPASLPRAWDAWH